MAKKKLTQKELMFKIVKAAGARGIKTAVAVKKGLDKYYIGCPDRRLRELREDGLIDSHRVEGSRNLVWVA